MLLLYLLAVFLATTQGQNPPSQTVMEFDCRRPGVDCGSTSSPAPCMSNGTCNCTNSLEGYDCTLNSTEVTPCGSCLNGATCLKNNEQPCQCSQGYYGRWCENNRAQLWCDGQGMAININPYGTENYTLFVTSSSQGGSENSSCLLTKITKLEDYSHVAYIKNSSLVTPELQGYFILLNHTDGNCGNASINQSESGRKDYIRKVVVTYDQFIVSSLDHLITLNCSMQNSTTFQTVSDTSVSVTEEDYTPVDVTKTFQPIIFEVTDDSGQPLASTVVLGQGINLVFTLADNSNYTSFKVTGCTASNGNTATSLTFNLLEKDCPTAQSKLVAMGEAQKSTTNGTSGQVLKKVTFALHAFKFKGTSEQVIFSCNCTMCRDKAADCDENTCGTTAAASGGGQAGTDTTTATAPQQTIGTTTAEATTAETTTAETTTAETTASPGLSRRKRSANQPDQKEVSSTIRVVGGSGTSSAQESPVSTEEDCMDRSQVITIIIIFSVAVLLLLVIVVAMAVGMYLPRLRRGRKVGFEETTSLYTLPRLSVSHDKPA